MLATPYELEMASKIPSPVNHTEKRKVTMAYKDKRHKYADGVE
jgi:hypothetical protein